MLLVDTETTGLDHSTDELIGLAVLKVQVDKHSGALVEIVDGYEGMCEPENELTAEAVHILGYDKRSLVGRRLDVARVSAMVESCDLVVAHNSAFDRPFVEKVVPAFCHRQWACSLVDIDWWHVQEQEAASMEHLARRLGHKMEDFSPMAMAVAMAYVLAQPLPATRETGFAALLEVAKGPFSQFVVPDPSRRLESILGPLGMKFSESDRHWVCVLSGWDAQKLQDTLVDLAVFNKRFSEFQIQEVDRITRFAACLT